MEEGLKSANKSFARVLVVDDHPGTATTLARAISQLGNEIEVHSAINGREAMDLLNGGSIDVLITDMMMPGMNGLELIEQCQSHPAGRPTYTILMTAYDVPGLKETAKRLKVSETIIKPVRPEQICQIVGNLLQAMGHSPMSALTKETHSFKILIADDIPDNITLISRYMQSEGYEYSTAVNGNEVLQKTRAEMPDLILLDVNMPEKDGFTVLREIRADLAIQHIPVIIFTATHLNPSDMQSGLNIGADDYITKPFDRRELFARIRTKLRAKEAEDSIRRQNRELSLLPEIMKEISASLDMDELLSVILRTSAETFGAFLSHVVIFRHEALPLKKSFFTSPQASQANIQYPRLEMFLNQVEQSRQGLIIDDVQHYPGWQTIVNDPVRSVAIAPMFGRNRLLGLLMLGHEKTAHFKQEHLLLLQTISNQSAFAVENIQLYEQIQSLSK